MKQTIGLVGRKVGMTRIFTDDGAAVPVTVLDVANNRVTQIKTPEIDGYAAVQVTYGKRRASRVNKAAAGHLAKAGVEAGELLKEFPVEVDALATFKVGEPVERRNVRGRAAGRRAGHDQGPRLLRRDPAPQFQLESRVARQLALAQHAGLDFGMAQDPGRVFPGKRMAGQYGNVTRTVQTLKVVRVDAARGLLLVKGAVPGADGGHIVVQVSVKTPAKKGA